MASVNRILLIGHLGQDPTLRQTTAGEAICTLSVATSERFRDKSGAQQEHTEWHRVVLFGRLAEIAGQYLHKGSAVYVEGSLRTRKWQDQGGQDRFTTEIMGSSMMMLDRKHDAHAAGAPVPQPEPAGRDPWLDSPSDPTRFGVFDTDDVPF